jgi:hypothetical protein
MPRPKPEDLVAQSVLASLLMFFLMLLTLVLFPPKPI